MASFMLYERRTKELFDDLEHLTELRILNS
jgi:hypothetical protein